MHKAYYQGPKSDHFDGKKFFNPWEPRPNSFNKFIYWKMTSKAKPWPKIDYDQQFDIPPDRVNGSSLRISFVGHSTILIQTQGLNILTDPIWSDRASPFKNFGPTRYSKPGILFENLPPIDLVLISHNHYDHLDIETINSICLRDDPRILTPLGNDSVIQNENPSIPVETLDWHQKSQFNEGVYVNLVPSQHWSGRHIFDKNKALWGAFVITTPGGNLFFCGDSGYGNGDIFRQTYDKFGPFRFAMLPIGAYKPRWFMKYAHMDPQEAVFAHKDLGGPFTAAIHFKTFQLGDDGFNEPCIYLRESCEKHQIQPDKFRTLNIGEAWYIPEL
ncbi:MAG: MBL fold metallo-hydrolase [Parachlamydiaceae bacterium]|nr:MBL fold metallo-hydrolase [Parachlamydiaceae bacterium]